jgi:hypothetical protein
MRLVAALALTVCLVAPLAAEPPAPPEPFADDDGAAEEPPADTQPFVDEEAEEPPIPEEHGGAGGDDDGRLVEPLRRPDGQHVPVPPPVEGTPPAYDLPPTPSLDNRADEREMPAAPAAPIVPY